MLNLSLKDLKLIGKKISIRGYKRMSKDELISSINESKPIKNKTIKGIRNLCRLKKDKAIKDKVLRDIETFLSKKKAKGLKIESIKRYENLI